MVCTSQPDYFLTNIPLRTSHTNAINGNFYYTALEAECSASGVSGREMFECQFNTPLVFMMCSYDGGAPENCSFPLTFHFERFGLDAHTVVVNVVDAIGRSLNITQVFSVSNRE